MGRKTTTNTYDNDTSNGHWYLGRLRSASVRTVLGDGSSDITRQSAYTYDTGGPASTGLLASETVEPGNTTCNTANGGAGAIACKLATAYGYDANGNKTSAATTGLGAIVSAGAQTLAATTRTTSTQYLDPASDPYARFAHQITNALNQSETWLHSAAFGSQLQHTGPNGQTTSWSYDGFGRKIREHRPDGTETQIAYLYCAGVNGGTAACPANAVVAVTATPTKANHTTQIGPEAITYYDSLYRVIAADVQGFGGAWIRSQTVYDALGRVRETSRPYFRDQGATIYWTVNTTFDAIGRVTLVTRPDTSTTSTLYNGLTSAVTMHIVGGTVASEKTTTRKNARGLVASVTNALNKTATYAYDAVGDLVTATDSAGNVTSYAYDVRGSKIASSDPDMGHWTYQYDAFGALYSQTDAKGQMAVVSYDPLGRAVKRTEADLVSQWIYGNDPGLDNVGKLIEACTGSCAGSDYQRSHTYDGMGRPLGAMLSIAGTAGVYTLGYETGTGRVSTLTYPSGLKVQYNYDPTLGYLLSITDTSNGQVLWTVNARDAEMHLQQSMAGDGVATIQYFDPATGLLEQIRASADGSDDGSAANFQYGFDSNGTLMQRTDLLEGYTESFCNDALNRLTGSAVGVPGSTSCTSGRTVKSVSYDDLGNILSKSDVGTYQYPAAGSAHPHAVSGIAGMVLGASNPHYAYDANGNVTCAYTGANCTGPGILRTTDAYTSFNMLARVSQANVNISLAYDSEHARITQQVAQVGTVTNTSYYNDPMSGAFAEMVTAGTTATWHDYVVADGHLVAERFKTGTATTWNWFVLDHLGSVAVITGSDGAHGMVIVTGGRMSYDAWGRTRNADASDDTTCSLPSTSPTTRGFTSQEEMPAVCLINYNARIYDPTLGRFLSPDSVTQNIYDMQLLNRFSYVGNNPLSFTDPTGHLFGIDDFFIAFVLVAVLAPEIHQIPILGSLATILAGFGCGPLGPVCAGIIAAEVTGIQGGTMAQAFKAFALTTFEGEAFKTIQLQASWSTAERALAAGMIGGITSVAGGGHFAGGFLAAGLSTIAAPSVEQINSRIGGTLASAVLGGVGSVLGGGKFANGAVTGAFAYAASANLRDEDPTSAGSSHSMSASGYDPGQVGPFSYQMAPGCNTADWCGADLKLHYTGDAKNLDWLQTFSAVSSREFGDWQIDDSFSSTPPFYTKGWANGPDFEDWPSFNGTRSFLAQTTLLSRGADGSYTVIGTVEWGYNYTTSYGGGVNGVTIFTPTLTSPSSIQQHWINSVNGH